ncbi:MAG: hypothetical protein R3A12_09030 [Ignavibacteria bacterium]|nr:hypothetical protein [Ignavibacteriota bacterium]
MSKFEISSETQALFDELDSLFPENIGVCRQDCINNYEHCRNTTNIDCEDRLTECYRKCYADNPNAELKQRADKILEKIQESLKQA